MNSGKRLGISKHPIWGKKFVMKIKSKNTGKEAKIMIKFNRKNAIVGADGEVDFIGGEIGGAFNPNRIRGGFNFDA